MGTEAEKTQNLLKLSSMVIHGLTRGIWELLGESAEVTAKLIGHENIATLEKEMGFEIAGEDVQDLLTELNRIFVDELGALERAEVAINENLVTMTFKGCKFMKLTNDLMQEGIPPFICPFKGMSMAAVVKRLGTEARLIESKVDGDRVVCIHTFETL